MEPAYLICADTETEAKQWAKAHNIDSYEYLDPVNSDPADFCDGTMNLISLKSTEE